MFRIMSSKRYWSLIGRIADDQETIKGQAKVITAQTERLKELAAEIEKKQKTNDYLNDLVFARTKEIRNLRRKLFGETEEAFEQFMKQYNIDFPSTERIPDPKTDINQILEQ